MDKKRGRRGSARPPPFAPQRREAVPRVRSMVCESSSPHTRGQSCLPRGEGNRESRWACHNAIYEEPRGCLQHPTGTAGRGRARWGDLPSEVWVRCRLATASVNDGCVPLPPLSVCGRKRERAAPAGSAYHGSLSSFINLSGCRRRHRRRLPVWGSASGQASVWDPAAAAASDRAWAWDPSAV